MKVPPSPKEQLRRAAGNRTWGRFLQAKPTVSLPGDPYEREADRVADRILRMPEPVVQRSCGCGGACGPCKGKEEETLQRQPVAGAITPLVQRQAEVGPEGEPEEEDEVPTPVQTKTVPGAAPTVPAGVAGRIERLGGGRPLGRAERAFFEPRFGYDFSGVRVHTGSEASALAGAVQARAFTTGRDVVFRAGQYAPETPPGKRLLAHELTHVVQQEALSDTVQRACDPALLAGRKCRTSIEREDGSPSSEDPRPTG